MKSLLITFVLSFILISLEAQDNKKAGTGFPSNEFGLNLGSTTGLGLSYRHWFDDFGIQLTGIPYKDQNEFFSSLAFTVMYSFVETKHVRVFAYLGNHYMHHKTTVDTSWLGGGSSTSNETDITDKWNIGFGPGFSFGTTVNFTVQAGYGFYDITGAQKILPAGEIGLYFRF